MGARVLYHSSSVRAFATSRAFLVAILAITCALITAIGPACAREASVISDVRIEGNKRIEVASVQSHLKLAPGQAYDTPEI